MNTYIDVYAYLRAVTGLETASLVGNKGRLTGPVIAGATSLPVGPALTVALAQFDQVTVFDGDASEVVMVGVSTPIGSTSIPLLEPLANDHAQYTPFCSDGILGSLADAIVESSNWIENICQQSLFQQSYTSETARIPSMRGSIDNRGNLVFRPRHFPMVTDTGIVIKASNLNPVTYDATQIILDGAKQVVTVPWLTSSGSSFGPGGVGYTTYNVNSREANLYLLIDYTAGYLPASMPGDIRDSAVLLTSEILARRQNPTGADSVRLGDKQLNVTTSRDTVGQSLLVKTAQRKLQPYSVEAY